MVVNQAMARELWSGRDPMGECVRIGRATAPCVTVIGIVENTHRDGLIEESDGPAPMYFVPGTQSTSREFALPTMAIVRGADRRTMTALAGALLADLRRTLPEGVYASVTPISDTPRFRRQLRPWVLGSTLFTAFGVLALVVAGVGTYSALAYSVSRRTREMGIRLALGAPPLNLLRLAVAEGLLPVGIGIGIGVIVAFLASPVIASLLYRTSPSDPVVVGLAAAVLIVTAAVGCVVPARRATRVDPVKVLRSE
jgi:ABC-type antimicrobial peptide transport system permease subunit